MRRNLNCARQHTISYEACRDLILVHTVQLKSKAHSSGRMVSSGVSDVVTTSVYSVRTHLKKLMVTSK